ncbi:hypothetical protein B566_EDAN009295 [Ephemera danica]|nr:hypothetical protein B566_EDAN009295 [Ephemera danica]
MDHPTKKKQTSKAPPTKNNELTSIDPPAKKKRTPSDPPAKKESATPATTIEPPAKKKVTPKTPPAVGQKAWKCPTGRLTEAQIQRILDQLQIETIHSYKCKEKKLKDLKAMNEKITMYPHRLEQPNAFYNNRGRGSLGLRDEMPHLITPLGDAACRGHLKCAEILLSRGANVNALTTGGHGPAGITILEAFMLWSEIPNHLDMLSLLVSRGASPLPEDNNGRDLLYEAVRLGEVRTVKFLLDHGVEVKNMDIDSSLMVPYITPTVTSPLQKALYSFHFDITKLLLLHGAPLSRNDWRCGKTEEKFTIPELLVNIVITSTEELWYYLDKDKQNIAIAKAPLRLLMSLKIYNIFGGRLGNILGYLNTVKKGEIFNGVRAELQELVSHPMNLKSMARLVIKKCTGKDYLKSIKNLAVHGLPEEVEQFLRFEDVDTDC